MRTLIVLCAGHQMRMQCPLYLNQHSGSVLLAAKVIENIHADTYDRIIYTVSQEDCEKYDAGNILQNGMPDVYPIQIFTLTQSTSGPAQSAYLTIKGMNVAGEIAIRDCTSSFCITENARGNFVAGLNLEQFEREVYRVRQKSFIVANEQGQILDIVEKSFRSDTISVGLYGFESAEDFVMAYERLSDWHHPVRYLYVSNIISYLIGYRQFMFHFVESTGYEDWKDPDAWSRLREKQGQSKLLIVDLDGTLFDTRRVNYMAYREALERHGFQLDYEYYCDHCNGKYYMDFLPQITTHDKMVLHQIHAEKKAAYKKYLGYAVLNKTLIDMLRLLGREYHKALVTTASKENTDDILNYFDMSNIFDLILTREDTEHVKPDPEGFIKAMAYFSALPENSIIFEDSEEGIEAARRSGAQCYVVKGFR